MNKDKNFTVQPQTERATERLTFAEKLIRTRKKNLIESLSDFENSEHRLESVRRLNHIDFINDSRATNINSVWFSLESMTKPTTWISMLTEVEDYTPALIEAITKSVRNVVAFTSYNQALKDFFDGLQIQIYFCRTMEDAVTIAYYASEEGDNVLFSPGTTAIDSFVTYRDRGNDFKRKVSQLNI